MYEIKKYLKLKKETLDVTGSILIGEEVNYLNNDIYKVVHLKPFEYSEENLYIFLDILFQNFIEISDITFLVTQTVNDYVKSVDISLLLNNVPFIISFEEDNIVRISGNLNKKFEMTLNLNHNKNNFTVLRRIWKEITSLTDWHFLRSKINDKLKRGFPSESDFGVDGFVKIASPESKGGEREVGEFVITPNSNCPIRQSGLKNISFKLDGNNLKVNNLSVESQPWNIHKDIQYYKDESERLKKISENSEKIYEEVRWVIFSARREERLKKLLDK